MEELINEILGDLKDEIGIESDSKEEKSLKAKIKRAIKTVRSRRRYPKSHTESAILTDLKQNYYDAISYLALYDFNMMGVEGQTMHTENTVQRIWHNREECLMSIVGYARLYP